MFLCLQCSKSCGRGYQYRPVECATTLNRAVSSSKDCDQRTKPPVWRQCNQGECGGFLFWRVGPWSQVKEYDIIWTAMFVTAGLVVKAPVLNKLQLSVFFSSQCSVSCGSGVMRRAVRCMARNKTYLDDSYCTSSTLPKPDPERLCQMKACKWQTRFSYLRRPTMQHIQIQEVYLVGAVGESQWTICFILEGPPTSCKEVQLSKGILTDGEQTLAVQGKELQVKLLSYRK